MRTQEIQHEQWQPFFDNFSDEHRGEIISVEVLDPQSGRQPVASNLPLLGITADRKDSLGEMIEVIAGDAPAANVNHDILKPTRVYLACGDDGKPVAVEIESAEYPKTIVRFSNDVEWPEMYGA
jgi:Family of unknown function (DUF5335)